ncbi:TadE/TadG family type IV pilus assembly protein [Janthinobacterium sp. 75]|uniref:TadE/TadG family type IV pilus assembly protein n=1 Tax=unclassified Janthinobacterium TaxID=2610881 RepID=UPI0010624DC9|nr:TadE/TadG family type IV pilus assembly protein [Janthinobacterium sp. 75]TDY32937.1 TadE-like protein [Janthinobacterium sp. 75]
MTPRRRAPRRQGGVAAIELALILLFFMGLLPFVLLFGRALLVYTALQKSVHDAARYMATMPLPQMGSIGTATQGVAFSRQMVVDAMAESWPHMEAARVSVDCVYVDESFSCGSYPTAPLQVRIKVTVDMPVDFLPELTRKWLPQLAPIPLRANATLRYVN